jgi:hypothetical protein
VKFLGHEVGGKWIIHGSGIYWTTTSVSTTDRDGSSTNTYGRPIAPTPHPASGPWSYTCSTGFAGTRAVLPFHLERRSALFEEATRARLERPTNVNPESCGLPFPAVRIDAARDCSDGVVPRARIVRYRNRIDPQAVLRILETPERAVEDSLQPPNP